MFEKYYLYYIYRMSNFEVHEGIIDMGEVVCPFCDEQISEIAKKDVFLLLQTRINY